jgi:hypothetical protein
MAKRDLFFRSGNGIIYPPNQTAGSGGGLSSVVIPSSRYLPPAIPESRVIDQAVIDSVIESYSAQLVSPSSDHSRFFSALALATTEEQLDTFVRIYIELDRGDYTVDDFLVYARKSDSPISIDVISSFSRNNRAAKVAGMREKIFNGAFPEYGNLYSYINTKVLSDASNQAFLRDVQEGDDILSQGNWLLLKPRVAYGGTESYRTYSEAVEDYWNIVSSYFTGTLLSSVTARTATVASGSRIITSILPNITGINALNPVYQIPVNGETGRLGVNPSVRFVISSDVLIELSVPHLASGDVTFKCGLPASYTTSFSTRTIEDVFNRNSNSMPYGYAALMADPASKTAYSSEGSINSRLSELAKGSYERLSRDEVLDQLSAMIGDLVDFYDDDEDRDYEDFLHMPDIRDFVVESLESIASMLISDYDPDLLRKLKFYKYIMAPFTGVVSSTSMLVGQAFTRETSVTSEFSALRSEIDAVREDLISSGKFDSI